MDKPTFAQEALIAWKWSSVVFGNAIAVILFLTWWQGESWTRVDNGSLVAISKAMKQSAPR